MAEFRKVVLAHKATRKPVIIFNTTGEAERHLGISKNSVRKQCVHKTLTRCTDTYFRYEDDFDPNEEFKKFAGCPIYIRHGNRVRVAYSMKDLENILSVAHSTASRALINGNYKGVEIGYLTKGVSAFDSV